MRVRDLHAGSDAGSLCVGGHRGLLKGRTINRDVSSFLFIFILYISPHVPETFHRRCRLLCQRTRLLSSTPLTWPTTPWTTKVGGSCRTDCGVLPLLTSEPLKPRFRLSEQMCLMRQSKVDQKGCAKVSNLKEEMNVAKSSAS